MLFSTRSEYGLMAMANLAKAYPKKKSLQEIATEEGISFKYLERLFVLLKKAGLVKSEKGKSGGYVIPVNPNRITALQIIEALEGSIIPMGCAGSKCGNEKNCKSNIVWKKLDLKIKTTLKSISLKRLI